MIRKTLVTAVAVILFSLSLPVQAESPCKKRTIEDLVKAVAQTYQAKTLGSLDEKKPYVGKVRIVIEHSLDEDHRFEIKWFRSLAQVETWLKSREREEELPNRQTRPLVRCTKGVCTYDFDGGILHNHLYLKKITYGSRGGCPYIRTIYLLDGD
jgi:hypothetical protein